MTAAEHVSPGQQGYVFSRSTGYPKTKSKAGMTAWNAHRGDLRVATLVTMHQSEVPERFHLPWHNPQDYNEAWHFHNKPEAPLFESTPGKPARDEVSSLFVTQRDRAVGPLMLGMAENVAQARTGQRLAAPEDLSPHSSRMVKHLQKAGAVPKDAPSAAVNAYTFPSAEHDPRHRSEVGRGEKEIIPPHEVRAGRQTMRTVLRGDRAQRRTDRSEQLRLF